ncbi:type II toxin-antitoxin system PemK/MazF family toxin [Nocardia arizonensis]|uniref:type II toxin-antitoxin system PemK/MazF family toxin n=1 Tax=Nocardia arizonensis TaxID=1141647 RepID=UPI0006D1663C|nr:type II toxin-antitoxin system PemK/MazF family toxin [Nocardia arizonensis]
MSARPSCNPGDVIWTDISPTRGHEQNGRRPAVVISTADYLRAVRGLVVIVPVTTTDRGWPHHVQLRGDDLGLPVISFAMTEQPRTASTQRITGVAGSVSRETLGLIRRWISDFTVMEG